MVSQVELIEFYHNVRYIPVVRFQRSKNKKRHLHTFLRNDPPGDMMIRISIFVQYPMETETENETVFRDLQYWY